MNAILYHSKCARETHNQTKEIERSRLVVTSGSVCVYNPVSKIRTTTMVFEDIIIICLSAWRYTHKSRSQESNKIIIISNVLNKTDIT